MWNAINLFQILNSLWRDMVGLSYKEKGGLFIGKEREKKK